MKREFFLFFIKKVPTISSWHFRLKYIVFYNSLTDFAHNRYFIKKLNKLLHISNQHLFSINIDNVFST
jgi:hypothetical protein